MEGKNGLICISRREKPSLWICNITYTVLKSCLTELVFKVMSDITYKNSCIHTLQWAPTLREKIYFLKLSLCN